MDGATVDAWLHFPGAKVGQNNFYFLPFLTVWWLASIVNRDKVRRFLHDDFRMRLT
jgi:hypothetical protein